MAIYQRRPQDVIHHSDQGTQYLPGRARRQSLRQAKPHFEAALKALQAAGKTLKDLFKFLVHNFGERSRSTRSSTLGKRDWDLTLRC